MVLRMLVAAACATALAGCGSADRDPGAAASRDRPVIRLATKNFTEQHVLGELYAQALRAGGFEVELKRDVGPSEVVDAALRRGAVDMYAEYTGVIVSELAHRPQQRTASQTYATARAFEARRGYDLLTPSPGADVLAVAVRPETAARHRLRDVADLERLGRFTFGGPAETRTRWQGVIGLKRAYGLRRLRYVFLPIDRRYAALDRGKVDVTSVFSTEGQLEDRRRYVVLHDSKGIFGFQNIAPVIDRELHQRLGPGFRRIVDRVTRLLTDEALRTMNGAVDLQHRAPAQVAERFLRRHGLLS